MGHTFSASTRRAKETASLNVLRWNSKNNPYRGLGRSDMTHCGIRQQIKICAYIILYTAIRGNLFCRAGHYFLVFIIFLKKLGGGTRLAMPKTICTPDSSSLKPGSGAT